MIWSAHRRKFLKLTASSALLIIIGRGAISQTDAAARLNLLSQLIEALSSAGDAMISITNGFEHMVAVSFRGYDAASARIVRRRLVNFSAITSQLLTSQRLILGGLDDYLNPLSPYHLDVLTWRKQLEPMRETLSLVIEILEEVDGHRSDFVLQDAYQRLQSALRGRSVLLAELIAMDPPPRTQEEVQRLQRAVREYNRLIKELEAARLALNRYLLQPDEENISDVPAPDR